MRQRGIIAALIVMAACGGGGDKDPTGPSGPTTGSIQFKLDANTCSFFGTQTLTFTFFIDGGQVGSASIGLTQNSPSYTVTPGSHVASATVTNSTLKWQNLTATVTAGQTFTYILGC